MINIVIICYIIRKKIDVALQMKVCHAKRDNSKIYYAVNLRFNKNAPILYKIRDCL